MGDERPSSSRVGQMRHSSVAPALAPLSSPAAPMGSPANGGDQPAPRKVMVVADPTRESMGALDWALSHALLEKDHIVLLHVSNSDTWRSSISAFLRRPTPAISAAAGGGGEGQGKVDFLEAMRMACEAKQPKVKVSVEVVEMEVKEGKGPTILAQTVAHTVDILVICQRRTTFSACRISGPYRPLDTAEYCIENSKCLCVGVQKKGQSAGYLLNTKKHRNFWHLS